MFEELGHDDDVETLLVEGAVEEIGSRSTKTQLLAKPNRRRREINPQGLPALFHCGPEELAVSTANIEKPSALRVSLQLRQQLDLPRTVLRRMPSSQVLPRQTIVVVVKLVSLRKAPLPGREIHEAARQTPIEVQIASLDRKHTIKARRCTDVTARHCLRLADEFQMRQAAAGWT